MMADQEARPVTRDTIEQFIWRMTGWQGTSCQMDELLGLIDQYALARSASRITAMQRMRLDAAAFASNHDNRGDEAEAPPPPQPAVVHARSEIPSADTRPSAQERQAAATQLRGYYDLIREGRMPVTGWKRVAEITELLEGEEAAAPFWRYVRGEPHLPDDAMCRVCRVPQPKTRFNKDKTSTGVRGTCRRCENSRDRAHKRGKAAQAQDR